MPRKRKGERSDGRIQITLDIGYNAEGKRLRKYFYGQTRAEAERKKLAYLDRSNNTYSHIQTVSQWIDEYISAYMGNINPLYRAHYLVPYNHIKAEIGERLISAVREMDLQALLNKNAGMSFSFITKYSQAIKRVFKKAHKNGLIPNNPADDLVLPHYTKGTHRALTKEEIDLIVQNYQKCYSGIWVLIMLFCGLRRGEMMALDWTSIDLPEHTLTVRQTAVISGNKAIIEQRAKSKAGLRIIPIPDIVYAALQDIPNKNGFVCLSAHGKPLTETTVTRGLELFNRVINRVIANEPIMQQGKRTDLVPEKQIFHIRYHDLRHTYATLLYSAGVDVKTAAYLLGHSDISVTMKVYTHLSEQKKAMSSQLMLGYFQSLAAGNSLEKYAEMSEK